MVPILRNADQLSIAEIEKAIADFGQRAKDGKLTLEDLTGGTFSITNGGVFGSHAVHADHQPAAERASSACTPPRSARWWRTARSSSGR